MSSFRPILYLALLGLMLSAVLVNGAVRRQNNEVKDSKYFEV